MARKIFVSYKHRDSAVQSFNPFIPATVRDYVDRLEQLFEGDHIYKGERDDEDLGAFKDEAIESHLRARIFDSSVTIVLISKNMKELGMGEDEQWIPWEVSYSLREKTREDRTSSSNAMLAVILPDETGSYHYFVEPIGCPHCSSIRWKNDTLFQILGKNMFNKNKPNASVCRGGICGVVHWGDDHSYIYPVRWDHFLSNSNSYINHAININKNIKDYKVCKVI